MNQARDEVSEAHILPSGYIQSRDTFHALAKNLGVEARRFSPDEQPGEHTRLSTDTVYPGRKDARKLVVIASGTHGVEGYAGAACQFRFMQTWRQRHARNDGIAYWSTQLKELIRTRSSGRKSTTARRATSIPVHTYARIIFQNF